MPYTKAWLTQFGAHALRNLSPPPSVGECMWPTERLAPGEVRLWCKS